MKKYNKLVLASIALMSLSACGQKAAQAISDISKRLSLATNGVEEIREVIYNDNKVYNIEQIILPHQEINIIKGGGTFKLYPRILPIQAANNDLTFSSENKTIASVDKNGVITGRGEGKTIITVASKDGSVSTQVPVNVVLNNKEELKQAALATEEAQKDIPEASKMSMIEYDRREKYVDGELATSEYELDNFMIDADNAFFAIEGYDVETKCIGGASTVLDYAWYIYTTANYETFLFHVSGNKRNYLKVDNSSYISQGKPRIEALYDVLDHLFTSGHAIMTNQLEYVVNKDDLSNSIIDIITHSYGNASYKGGHSVSGENDFYADINITFKNQIIANDEESDYKIPAGTKYDATQSLKYSFQDNLCTFFGVDLNMTYVLDEQSYSELTHIERYISPELELHYPVRSEFSLVDSIYDL